MTTPPNYADLSETNKDISKLEHLDTLDANTDQIEGLLGTLINTLKTTNSKLDTANSHLSAIKTDIAAISSNSTTANSLLQDIKTNTTPENGE